jgi:DNA-binding transcriptional ArsR family regulator
MPRVASTSDAFNAIAEPRRREILGVLARGEQPVNDLVQSLGWAQPQVSKHLAVLREVGLVSVRGAGRQRLYSLRPEPLKSVHDWVQFFERFWDNQLDRIKQRAEAIVAQEARPGPRSLRTPKPRTSKSRTKWNRR